MNELDARTLEQIDSHAYFTCQSCLGEWTYQELITECRHDRDIFDSALFSNLCPRCGASAS